MSVKDYKLECKITPDAEFIDGYWMPVVRFQLLVNFNKDYDLPQEFYVPQYFGTKDEAFLLAKAITDRGVNVR